MVKMNFSKTPARSSGGSFSFTIWERGVVTIPVVNSLSV
jgi:hypothetical protein